VFISAPWEDELVVRDLAFVAGFELAPPAAESVAELRLLASWHLRFTGRVDDADRVLATLPAPAWVATAQLLAERGDEAAARDLLRRAPTSPR
jgi:hypothetical protein